MPQADLDTEALLAAAENLDQQQSLSLRGLWPQALRALVTWYESPQEYAAIQEQTRAVLLAAQERLLPGRAEGEEG